MGSADVSFPYFSSSHHCSGLHSGYRLLFGKSSFISCGRWWLPSSHSHLLWIPLQVFTSWNSSWLSQDRSFMLCHGGITGGFKHGICLGSTKHVHGGRSYNTMHELIPFLNDSSWAKYPAFLPCNFSTHCLTSFVIQKEVPILPGVQGNHKVVLMWFFSCKQGMMTFPLVEVRWEICQSIFGYSVTRGQRSITCSKHLNTFWLAFLLPGAQTRRARPVACPFWSLSSPRRQIKLLMKLN